MNLLRFLELKSELKAAHPHPSPIEHPVRRLRKKIVEILPQQYSSLNGRIQKLVALGATELTVPSHPRGKPCVPNLQFYRDVLKNTHTPTTLHVTVGHKLAGDLEAELLSIAKEGVDNILLVKGDSPSQELRQLNPRLISDSGLETDQVVRLVKEHLNKGKSFSGDALVNPTRFTVGCAVNLTPSSQNMQHEAERLARKIASGADYLISQPLFDISAAEEFLSYFEREYRKLDIPLICGVLPLRNAQQVQRIAAVPGIYIPKAVTKQLAQIDDTAQFQKESLNSSLGIVRKLTQIHPQVNGIHAVSASQNDEMIVELFKHLEL